MTVPETLELPPLDDISTVALLFREFERVLIPLDDVRRAYFRNLNLATFRRALRDWRIPLPVITLDESEKAQAYVCIYHLAALIEARAYAAAHERKLPLCSSHYDHNLHQRMRDAVPTTQFQDVAMAAPRQ